MLFRSGISVGDAAQSLRVAFAGVEVGDWVFYRVSDGFLLMRNGTLCRLLEEVHVKGKIPSPDVVF